MKRLAATAALLALVFVGVPATGATADDAEVTCANTWGSLAKAARPLTSPDTHVVNVRAGRHECFDRLVIDHDAAAPGYHVQYVRRYRHIASGEIIPTPGGARLEIIVRAPAIDDQGHATYDGIPGQALPRINLAGFQTFRSTRYGGTFEGQTSFGLGVRARLPFRVMKLGNRLVIDVAHHWPS
jgi:hypothetical protein